MMLNWVTTLDYAYDLALGSEVYDGPEGGVELLVLECLASKKPLGFSFDEEQRLKQLNKWTERYDDKKRADLPTFALRLFHILDVKDPDNQKRETPTEVGSVLLEHFFEKYVGSTSPRHDGVQLEHVNCDKEPERCEDPKQGHAEL